MKPKAIWAKCTEYDPKYPIDHQMLDYCYTCAPWWEDVPRCQYGHKLNTSGYCSKCQIYYDLTPQA